VDNGTALARLRQKIIEELFVERWHEVWFFPERDGVKGWRGTAPIMFVGPNPSTGHFGSRADHFFYKNLADNGFQNAHLTDAFKMRATAEEVPINQQDSLLSGLNRGYIQEEVTIIQPRLLVALSENTYDLLSDWLPEMYRERLVRIPHYSWAHRYRKEDRFAQAMNDVRLRFAT
jgi:hypothetical protein